MDFRKIERKWQKKWEAAKIFRVTEGKKKKKYYILEMFPYPSGSGLHMGHARNYLIGDCIARFKRMCGFNVLYPMGYDSFGLPAENAAIKAKIIPKDYTEKSISSFIKQQKSLGLSYDWSRMIATHKPSFYKWDQWIFLKMFEKGLVFRKRAPVNWCPKCSTALANEQVHNGKCWRHADTDVEIKYLEQWFFKITDYAEELYDNIEKLKGWPEDVMAMQRNWIGKSHGIMIDFKIDGKVWPIFTTRSDTIYGVTFMVISAQHPELTKLATKDKKVKVEQFLKKIKSTSEKELELLEKEGVFTGRYAVNPLTNEKVPIYAGNFVIAEYGSGMVMAVPAHDQRDFEFAKKYGIPIKIVIQNGGKNLTVESMDRSYTDEGALVNSGEFDGINSKAAIEKISDYIEKQEFGKRTTQYKLKDWLISRQRYWGTPIPIVYCKKCGIVPVPEKELPVLLPDKVKFGEGNPLETNKNFVNTKCPKCKGKARRETDTMDTFVNSSWYFLRYCDSQNGKRIFDKDKVAYWMPIDQYIGGKEHACMHLIYFRFYTKFLRDIGLLNFDEPTLNLFNQGMLHGSDGAVMSKSKGNVVLPEEISRKYGIDTARLFLLLVASPDKDVDWSDKGIIGCHRFVNRFYGMVMKNLKKMSFKRCGENLCLKDKFLLAKTYGTVNSVAGNIEKFQLNVALGDIMRLVDAVEEHLEDGIDKNVLGEIVKNLILILSPFAPHLCEELWAKIGNKSFISLEKWSKIDEKKIDRKILELDKLFEKILEDLNNIVKIAGKKKNAYLYFVTDKEFDYFNESKKIVEERFGFKVHAYKVSDKKKYDPQSKSSKAKYGKPGIFLD